MCYYTSALEICEFWRKHSHLACTGPWPANARCQHLSYLWVQMNWVHALRRASKLQLSHKELLLKKSMEHACSLFRLFFLVFCTWCTNYIVWWYGESDLKNPWVCGFGYYTPKPMHTNPLGLAFAPLTNPWVAKLTNYTTKPCGSSECAFN